MPAAPAQVELPAPSDGFLARVTSRLRYEIREWRTPSNPSFIQEELDHALLNEIHWMPNHRLLDVGCGSGHYCTAVQRRGVNVTGVDISLTSLTRARQSGHRVGQASALNLPFADGAFDVVFSHRTLYLLSPPPAAAAELARVIAPAGRIIFSTSNQYSPYMRIQSAARRRTENARWQCGNNWTAQQWIRAFQSHGFRSTAIFSCNLVWPIVFRVCDTWLVPNEWMRRYARAIRRVTRTPLRTDRLLGSAQDFLIEMTR